MKVTADTITDEQIRELQSDAWQSYCEAWKAQGFRPPALIDAGRPCSRAAQETARARCADGGGSGAIGSSSRRV